MDREAKAAALDEKKLWASKKGFDQWKRSFGTEFSVQKKGDRAKWLGGSIVSIMRIQMLYSLVIIAFSCKPDFSTTTSLVE